MERSAKRSSCSLHISETVVEKIAKLVVDEIEGVAGMGSSPAQLKDLLFQSSKNKPIRMRLNGDVAELDVYVILKQGFHIKQVAESIQDYVKDAVQNMANVAVSKVNVYVQGVLLNKQ